MDNGCEYILDISNLKMHYISKMDEVSAINGITFKVKRGDTFGLVGESGCGKSTVCKSILKILPPSAKFLDGSIKYKNEEIIAYSQRDMQKKIRGKEISISFQEVMTALNPVTKVKEQLFEQFRDTKLTKKEKYEKALNLLKLVGIPSPEQRLEEFIHQFSGGMRQRIMIAAALAAEPSLLIADEPTTALDVTIQDQIIKLINKLKRELNMSVILVTHDLGVVGQMCDQVAVMYAGYIVELADTVTLFSKPRHPYTEGLINSMPKDNGKNEDLIPIPGSPPNLNCLPTGCPFHPRCPYTDHRCRSEIPEMFEVEPGHFTKCHHLNKIKEFKGIISLDKEA